MEIYALIYANGDGCTWSSQTTLAVFKSEAVCQLVAEELDARVTGSEEQYYSQKIQYFDQESEDSIPEILKRLQALDPDIRETMKRSKKKTKNR